MADRTSARVFGRIFELLAKYPTEQNKQIAKEIFSMTVDFDFSNCQMYADNSLIALGLARLGVDPDYPLEGEVIIYEKI